LKIDTVVCAYGEHRNAFWCVRKDDFPQNKYLAKHTKHENISNRIYFELLYSCIFILQHFINKNIYLQDVKVQKFIARLFARKYNKQNPPANIKFIKARIIELVDRPDKPMYWNSSLSMM
jgi:Alpha-kinase family